MASVPRVAGGAYSPGACGGSGSQRIPRITAGRLRTPLGTWSGPRHVARASPPGLRNSGSSARHSPGALSGKTTVWVHYFHVHPFCNHQQKMVFTE
ncbi:hypothetical protein BaRGS_00019398 [Batillaria attramentaria]|uniref:Uncharacterized protein n=1 Tax=Batillaria attramentaria TaxID=370345 RepID=A0ABD0KQB7_9CAEN